MSSSPPCIWENRDHCYHSPMVISQGTSFLQWFMEALDIFTLLWARGQERYAAIMASNVLKPCQLTGILTSWCVIWKVLTPNFHYDCDIMILETSDRISPPPLAASPRPPSPPPRPPTSHWIQGCSWANTNCIPTACQALWQQPGVAVLDITYTSINRNVHKSMWRWIRLNLQLWEASRS